MASNSIQIYNDTVLKQSILQGYQFQRTNDNLGRFTMGELAFTRDTGRVFVGNFTNTPQTSDTYYVKGGILTGNKYLGFIDSKPLIHFAASGSKGSKPLSYTEDTKDEDTNEVEHALFGQKSRFRQEDGEGGNGWNKKAEYIQKYGVYSGDYTFDVYNNALILFDKNLSQTEEPIRQITYDSNGRVKELYIDKNTGNPIDIDKQKRRTPLIDNVNKNNGEYGIYGDGFVVMRILEPDGVTLGYKDRTFKYNSGDVNEDGSPVSNDGNWSHNYLEVKSIPATTLSASFSSQFETRDKKVWLKSKLTGVDEISTNNLILPSTLTVDNKKLIFNFDNTNFTSTSNDNILTLTRGANDTTYNVSIKKQTSPSFTIQLKDGLVNPITGSTLLNISETSSGAGELAIGLKTNSTSLTGAAFGYDNPFFLEDATSQYTYIGTMGFDISGSLKLTEEYDINYVTAAKSKLDKFDNLDNVSLNYLKNPLPICWNNKVSTPAVSAPPLEDGGEGTSISYSKINTKLLFLTAPYFHCIKKDYNSEITNETAFTNYTSVLGNNTLEQNNTQSSIPIVDGYSFPAFKREFYNTKIKGNDNSSYVATELPLDFINTKETSSISSVPYDKNGNKIQNPTDESEIDHYEYEISSSPQYPSASEIQKPYDFKSTDFITDAVTQKIKPKEEYESYEILFTLIGDRTLGFLPYEYAVDDILDLKQYLATTDVVSKIEMSTSSSTKEFITLFDKSVSYNNTVNTNADGVTIIKLKDDRGVDNYQCVFNCPAFTRNTYAPYFIKVTLIDGTYRYIYMKDVINYRNQVIVDNEIIAAYADKTGQNSLVTLSEPLSYYDKKAMKINALKCGAENIENIIFITSSTETQVFSTGDAVKKNGTYYTWVEENINVKNDNGITVSATIHYRATGKTSITDDNYFISKIVAQGVTYNWSDTAGKEQIKKFLNRGLTTPTSFIVEYPEAGIYVFSIKKTAGHPTGYSYPDIDSSHKFTIPAHASSVILEVHRNTSSNYPISIYFAGHFEDLSNTSSAYSFPFTGFTAGSYPTLNSGVMDTDEKMLYNTTESGCEIIEVPLHKTTVDGNKGFAIRLANVPCGTSDDKFLIRIIGYRV